jgi:hypothetical protein
VRGLPTYRTSASSLARAAAAGFGVATAVGVLWGLIPEWNFYLMLLLGFGVAEAMAWAARGKRGRDLQLVGFAAIITSLVIGRIILARRLGIPWEAINNLAPGVEDELYLTIFPDGLFAALALLIVWYRFR